MGSFGVQFRREYLEIATENGAERCRQEELLVIEKMKFLSITGPKDDIDRVVEQYLSKYDQSLQSGAADSRNADEGD